EYNGQRYRPASGMQPALGGLFRGARTDAWGLPQLAGGGYTLGMAKTVSADAFLEKPSQPGPVCVVFGDDAFLRREVMFALRDLVLGEEDAELSFTRFDGPAAKLSDVLGELEMVAMFGSGQRLVMVEQADTFLTAHRADLESYTDAPCPTGVLMLELKSFPSNTRLYKLVVAKGMAIDANTPKAAELVQWVVKRASRRHASEITSSTAGLLVELVGPELGLLDQELAKLALGTGASKQITPELVKQHVGSWRVKTAWELIDAALDGKVAEALRQLDLLLGAGEQPVGILAQISYAPRQLAAATRLILQSEAAGRRISIGQALEQAGVRSFGLRKAEQQLRRLGRQRGQQIYRWLLSTDMDLKGASSAPPRLILEKLIVRLAAAPPA
ncbi:MAG: DNA polymerase III subunit delta, partial [Patescibacteria group bacterium]|nr:DNA polymerase III subunit delta [Patescibacteria group bacterium]